jgi:GH15 family glucan-1,4-alpha-glucosidase
MVAIRIPSETAPRTEQARIAEHGIIGDGRSTALVSRDGSLDWLCWPRFESPPIFAALLDPDRGGAWTIRPMTAARITRSYVEGTNVLETRFATSTGRAVLTDLMTISSEQHKEQVLVPDHEVVRRVRCETGHVELEVCCRPRPDFGRRRTRVGHLGKLGVRWEIGIQLLTLRADVPLRITDDGDARALVRLSAGESATFSLTFDEEAPVVLPPIEIAGESIERSLAWWRDWIGHARYDGRYREDVLRGALVLKLMSFAPSGAIVAAPTTSLPERVGGDLNWDYRFCWLRDAAFTARALLSLGYVEDAEAYCGWLLHATRLTRPELHNTYDVYGNLPEPERSVSTMRGYFDSRPVRTGCATTTQLQLDNYGEVIDATAMLARTTGHLDRETQRVLRGFGDFVCEHWRAPDAGIWEPRENMKHRTHSKLLCWVALDRLIDLYDRRLVQGVDRDRYARERAAIQREIEQRAYDPRIGAYTAVYDETELDAAVLLMSWYGFAAPNSLRMRSTYATIRDRLSPRPGLIYRYDDSMRSHEGAFWICSFWAAEHLATGGGTLGEAVAMFDAARAYMNDLGLMAEEVEPRTREAIGNFPQAYTHVGLINAALSIEERQRRDREERT